MPEIIAGFLRKGIQSFLTGVEQAGAGGLNQKRAFALCDGIFLSPIENVDGDTVSVSHKVTRQAILVGIFQILLLIGYIEERTEGVKKKEIFFRVTQKGKAFLDACTCVDGKTELISVLSDLKKQGLSFSDVMQVYGIDSTSSAIAQTAKDIYEDEGSIEVRGSTVLSAGEDGTYVLMWGFVHKEAYQKTSPEVSGKSKEDDPRCSVCNSTEGIVSTYCGSFCNTHLAEHVESCQICAAEFKMSLV